ncbi:MAG: flagellar hook-associated protein FlgK [Spirochaetaceae bacterium]|jgi:flagellar hook-associated protein 1 FlgK|nr:flagellar hook-associated protein FlgK [Spirochaetaceae bacterium]
MTSSFMGLEIGKRAVNAHEQALRVTGQNLSNVSTEGYSRQRAEFKTVQPIYLPGLNREEGAGQLGQGVSVDRIERIRDELLDKRIVAEAGKEGYWQARDPYLRQIDGLYLEVGENSLRSKMLAFWDGWQDLSQHPSDLPPRTALIARGESLIGDIHERFSLLKGMKDQVNEDIYLSVDKINNLSGQIASLNETIQKVIAQGDRPNDLFDRRDMLVDELSKMMSITVEKRDSDEYMLHTGGVILVQGRIARSLEITNNMDKEGYGNIMWTDTAELFSPAKESGSLSALLELRDKTIENEIQVLDNMTMNFVDLVNEAHRPGYGINSRTGLDFFTEHHFVTNVQGNYDRNGDGEYDSSYIFRMNGLNQLEERAQIGLEGTITLSASGGEGRTVAVPYYAEDTVADLVTRVNNSGADVVARLNRDGHLELKGTITKNNDDPDFVIRHVEDSGRFLEAYAGLLSARGEEGAFDWGRPDAAAALRGEAGSYSTALVSHPSGWIEINPVLVGDVASIASGYGENGRVANPGNSKAAEAIASIQNTKVMIGSLATIDDYFADSIGRVGLLHQESEKQLETHDQIMRTLHNMRSSISGVNMDEEISNMIKYQHGYAAAARFMSTVNSMLDIVLRLGQA